MVFKNLGDLQALKMFYELKHQGYSEDDAFTELYSIECSMDCEE